MSSFYIKNIKSFLEEEEKSILSDLAAGITNLNFDQFLNAGHHS